jgi:DNA mismatch repair protein MutS2
VLEALNREERLTIATTHQNQLKYYASEAEGVQNAAMQFDSKELRPLFTLEWGIPGSSYTFEICRRLGLDETILNRAIELSGKEHFKLDRLLAEVSESSQKYNRLRQKLSVEESRLNGLIQLYQVKSDTLSQKRKQFEKEAREQARQILESVNKEVEKTIREIRESQADKQVVKKARSRLNALKTRVNGSADAAPKPSFGINDLSVGQRARSVQYQITGVISKIFRNRGEVELEQNGLKISVPLNDLEVLSENGTVKRVEAKPTAESAGVNIHNELDLRGLTTDEAIREVERYIDLALLSNWDEVRLVHGKGTGALRQAVHAYLRGLATIKAFRLGKWGEGDTGVTVVKL